MNLEQEITNSMYKLSYGLYLLTAKDGDRQNGCIINTAVQVTDTPKRIAVTVNKANLTCEMISRSGEFNLSMLTESAPFELFEHFGLQSGRDADKMNGGYDMPAAINGIRYLTEHTNAVVFCKAINQIDCGTHIMFIADVISARVMSDEKSVTYNYYSENIKPKPENKTGKKGYVCKICGYVYEGETLPSDFVCPLCKHPASDFEPIEN